MLLKTPKSRNQLAQDSKPNSAAKSAKQTTSPFVFKD